MNIKPIRDYVERQLTQQAGRYMVGDSAVRVDVAAQVAADAVAMTAELIAQQQAAAQVSQRWRETVLSAAAVILAADANLSLEDATLQALQLRRWIDHLCEEGTDDEQAGRETRAEAAAAAEAGSDSQTVQPATAAAAPEGEP